MVTSQKMSENEMGYRGSKSEIPLTIKISVKEQRVDGGNIVALPLYNYKESSTILRYTLMVSKEIIPLQSFLIL